MGQYIYEQNAKGEFTTVKQKTVYGKPIVDVNPNLVDWWLTARNWVLIPVSKAPTTKSNNTFIKQTSSFDKWVEKQEKNLTIGTMLMPITTQLALGSRGF